MFWHRSTIAALLLFPISSPALVEQPGSARTYKEVRVRLGTFHRVSLSGVDLTLNDGIRFEGSTIFSLRCGRDREGTSFIEFGAGRKALTKLEIYSPSGFLHLNGKLYRNRITVSAQGENCSVVNTLDLNKYLAGLINKEMLPNWPLEALKAQAVASRSYALHQIQASRDRDFDVESTTQDQVYEGAASETAKSNQAVLATQDLVLSFGGNQPAKAYFHANCGGMTEVPEAVWGNEAGRFRAVHCPYHKKERDRKRWSLSLTRAQIENALRKISGLLPANFRRLAKLEDGAPNASRRLSDVIVSDASGNNFVVPAAQFRSALGNTKVKSTAFRISAHGDRYEISGEGFGHGVGMCQVGARAMAEEGKAYQDILRHYYPTAKIVRL